MDEVLELLEGCRDILDSELEETNNPTLWVVRNTIADCIEKLDEEWNNE